MVEVLGGNGEGWKKQGKDNLNLQKKDRLIPIAEVLYDL